MECFLNQVLLTLTIYWESKPRGKRAVGASRTYRQEVEKMDEKVEKLERNYM